MKPDQACAGSGAVPRELRDRAENWLKQFDQRDGANGSEAIFADILRDLLAALTPPPSPAVPIERAEWITQHLDRGHTVTKQADYDECSCGATYWRAAAPAAGVAPLFQTGDFELHSGERSTFKINCDRLTGSDYVALSNMLVRRIPPFSRAEGVPRGGTAWAEALNIGGYTTPGAPVLIVDDVLTTGASMEQQRAGREAIGAVIFARGPCPSWVTPLFTLQAEGVAPTLEKLDDALIRRLHAMSREDLLEWISEQYQLTRQPGATDCRLGADSRRNDRRDTS